MLVKWPVVSAIHAWTGGRRSRAGPPSSLGLAAASTVFLAISASTFLLALIGSAIAGVARGLLTLIQATSVTDRWGIEHFGRLNGILGAPVMLAAALAPFGGSISPRCRARSREALLIPRRVVRGRRRARLRTRVEPEH